MTSGALRAAVVALAAAGLTACTSTITSRPDLVAAGVSAPVVQGKATLVMSAAAANSTISPHPTSFTGGATSINIPMGQIVRGVGDKVLSAGFSKGATSGQAATPGSYTVAVEVANFSYAYNQLSNLGLAITPLVTVGMTADVKAPDGHPVLHKTYAKADVTAGVYGISMAPAEKINESLHMALAQIFRDLLDDIAAAVK